MAKRDEYIGALRGYRYGSSRPFGSKNPWNVQAKKKALAEVIRGIVRSHDAARFGLLGSRGIGYIMKGTPVTDDDGVAHHIVKEYSASQKERARLGLNEVSFDYLNDLVTEMRRSGLLSMDSIADDRTRKTTWPVTDDLGAWLQRVLSRVGPDLWAAQERQAILVVEARGTVDFWEAVAERTGMPVWGTGGDAAIDLAWQLANLTKKRPVHMLLIVDMDGEGIEGGDRIIEDVRTHMAELDPPQAASRFTFEHVGLLPEHVADPALSDLPTSPPKVKDLNHGFTATAEVEPWTALYPDHALATLEAAVARVFDPAKAEAATRQFEADKQVILDALAEPDRHAGPDPS